MPETRSPEALRTWIESLLTQVDHCTKESAALADAIEQALHSPDGRYTVRHTRSVLVSEQFNRVARLLSLVQATLNVTRDILTPDEPDRLDAGISEHTPTKQQ